MIKTFFSVAFCCLLSNFQAIAQNEDYKSTFSATIGPNIYNLSRLVAIRFPEVENIPVKFYTSPTYGLNYDYGFVKWFSLGGSYTYNYLNLETDKARIAVDTFVKYEGYLKAYARRHTVALRCMFHYGNSGRFDMYSGFRLGASFWSAGINSETNELTFADIFQVADFIEPAVRSFLDWGVKAGTVIPTAQFVPFGVRGYVTENIAIGLETNVGAPSIINANVSFRF